MVQENLLILHGVVSTRIVEGGADRHCSALLIQEVSGSGLEDYTPLEGIAADPRAWGSAWTG